MALGALDIILIICFIPALFLGIKRGLVDQIISIVAIILGSHLAFLFASTVTGWLAPSFPGTDLRWVKILSFVLILVAVFVAMFLLGRAINKLLKITTLSWMNRALGLVFAIFTSALLIGLVMSVITGINTKVGIIDQKVFDSSPIYKIIRDASDKVFPFLKEFFAKHA